jgi:NAD(P)-dependent dehydrogenase (short-subunit alcohol dehydrogenase family)
VDLQGRVAIVSGGGQGVGRGIAITLATHGARVAIVELNPASGPAVADEIEARGGEAVAVTCDVSVRAEVDAAVATVVERWNALDIVVNNACAAVTEVPLEKVTDAHMDLAWRTGVLASLYFMQAGFPHLKRDRGAVVNVGSIAGISGMIGCAAYGPAKEAIRSLTKVAAREWGQYGIRVNAICPNADSPARQQWRLENPDIAASAEIENLPLGRVGDCVDDIGPAVAFLCSSAAQYITGHTLMVDGGSCV